MTFLVGAGNFDSIPQIHPALMDRITGYGKVVRMSNDMDNTLEHRRNYVQFISQEIKRFHFPPFSKEACIEIINEGRRKSNKRNALTTKFRPLISIIKTAATLAIDEPLKYLVEGTQYTDSLTDTTYLVFTYRLGIDKLKSLVDFYSDYLGKPVYAVEDKICVFSYDRKQMVTLLNEEAEEQLMLFDDEQVEDGFWQLQLIGKGNITFSISDETEVKKRGTSGLQVTISPGEHERATLRHVWDEPLDFSEATYLMLFVNGANTKIQYDIIFRGATKDPFGDYFSYRVTDNFYGWKQLIVPLDSFFKGGNPSWSAIKEMLLIFRAGGSPSEIYFDQISAAERVPLQLLYAESTVILP